MTLAQFLPVRLAVAALGGELAFSTVGFFRRLLSRPCLLRSHVGNLSSFGGRERRPTASAQTCGLVAPERGTLNEDPKLWDDGGAAVQTAATGQAPRMHARARGKRSPPGGLPFMRNSGACAFYICVT